MHQVVMNYSGRNYAEPKPWGLHDTLDRGSTELFYEVEGLAEHLLFVQDVCMGFAYNKEFGLDMSIE
jgi:hypothetical protein